MRRVSIRAGSREVDAKLPAHIPIGEMLPATVDLVTASDDGLRASFLGQAIGICRVGVPPLDPSQSLAQAGVADGELLIMTAEHITAPIYRFDPCPVIREVAEAASPSAPSLQTPTLTAPLICWAGILELLFAVRALTTGHESEALIGILAAAVAAVLAAVTFRRSGATHTLSVLTAVWAAMFAAASGALVVPGNLAASHLLLGMSACSTTAFLLARLLACGTSVLMPISGASGAAAFMALGAALNLWPSAAVGPGLVVLSLTTLAMGPRLAALVARLTDEEASHDDLHRRAVFARGLLSNFVTTSAGGTALGCALTATCGSGGAAAGSLIVVSAVVLLSHTRRHRDPHHAATLTLSAAAAVTAYLLTVDIREYFWAPWVFISIVPSALTCAWLASREEQPSVPFGRRIVEGIEFTMSAAVPALACWAAGLFSAVRGLTLS